MRFTLDPWEGDLAPTDDPADLALTEGVEVDHEVPPDSWAPLDAVAVPFDRVVFVDGVQSSDALLAVGDDDLDPVPALAASWAAGAVVCDPTRAHVAEQHVVVERAVFSDFPLLAPIAVGGVVWRVGSSPVASPSGDAPDLAARLRNARRTTEQAVGAQLARDGSLVVFDGMGMMRSDGAGGALWRVGLAKRAHARYLAPGLERVVWSLARGQRSPLFRLPDGRWSFYASVADPLSPRVTSRRSTVVRCEVEAVTARRLDEVRTFADRVTATLPPYATLPWEDPRAPVNLRPVRGLEQDLKRRLGDRTLLRRLLAAAAAASS